MNPTIGSTLDYVNDLFSWVRDRAGRPYVLHCVRVMGFTLSDDPDVLMAALLHDVLEDTDVTDEDLLTLGYSARTVELVDLLTRISGQTYRQYLDRMAHDRDALLIKSADNRDNTDLTRWPDMPASMLKRYTGTRRFLDQRLAELAA